MNAGAGWTIRRWLLVALSALAAITVSIIRTVTPAASETRGVRAAVSDYLGDIARGHGADACRDLSPAGITQLRRVAAANSQRGRCAQLLGRSGWALIDA
jgi:hypothetical protein